MITSKTSYEWINPIKQKCANILTYHSQVNTLPWPQINSLLHFAWYTVFFEYKVWVESEYIILMFNWYWFFIHRPSNFNQSFWAERQILCIKFALFNSLHFQGSRVLTRKWQLGLSGPNWKSEHSEHACVSKPKCSWGFWGGGGGGTLSPPSPQQGS